MTARVVAQKVSLRVPLYLQGERSSRSWLSMMVGAVMDPPKREFREILSDISLDLKPGDRVALLGRNGAGKSTLLRVLNGVFQPTTGFVQIHGTCQALLNTSLGFNNEATVKENVFLRGAAMGLGAKKLPSLVEPVLEFSGLQEKSGHRLKTLSAGQRMRLGFAISTEVQHDIMLLDEWIGTGDMDFLKKAQSRMQDRMHGSKIVVLASHNFAMLRSVCNRGVLLDRGRLVFAGTCEESIEQYSTLLAAKQ